MKSKPELIHFGELSRKRYAGNSFKEVSIANVYTQRNRLKMRSDVQPN